MSWIENPEIKILITYFENITTHTCHLDVKSKKGDIKSFELIQIHEGKLELSIPKLCCTYGHQVEITIQAISGDYVYPLKTRAKVLQWDIEPGDNQGEVLLELHHKNDTDYVRFYELIKERQNQVTQLFEAVKSNG